VVDDNPAAKEAVGEITTSTEDNDSQQAPDDVEIELTGDVPAEGGETPAEEPAATEVDASNDSGVDGGDVDGGVEQPAEEPTPDAVPAEVADASTSTTEAPVEPAPAEHCPASELTKFDFPKKPAAAGFFSIYRQKK
jgi:hypothetical protein